MKKYLFATLSLCLAVNAYAKANYDNGEYKEVFEMRNLKKHEAVTRTSSSSPLLSNRGGSVLHAAPTAAIFWGSQWTNSTFAGDKITGIDSFFEGYGQSQYAMTCSEYSDNLGHVTGQSNYLGHVIDSSAAPRRALKVSEAVAEVCRATNNNPDPQTVYFIYTATQVNTSYCAWHSWGNCANGAKVQVSYMPNIDGIAGCDPEDSSQLHSQGLAAIANVTAHELSEAITDPRGNSWLDSAGAENGDKCAWRFPAGDGLSTFSNGSKWKLQMEWSNAAFLNGTGLANSSGQKGCVY